MEIQKWDDELEYPEEELLKFNSYDFYEQMDLVDECSLFRLMDRKKIFV